MKFLIFLSLLISFSFSSTITCKGTLKTDTIYEMSNYNVSILSVSGEVDDGFVYGDIDPANSSIAYYDNNSAICGGSASYNRIVEAYCDWNFDSCFDVTIGSSGYSTISFKDGKYTNNTTLVNGLPCLPYGVSTVNVGYYDENNNDIGNAYFSLTDIDFEQTIELTKDEAKQNRDICPSLIKYIDEWEDILSSQNDSINTPIIDVSTINLDNFNNRIENLNLKIQTINNADSDDNTSVDKPDYSSVPDTLDVDPDIDSELNGFKSDLELSITSSFDKYSNVFGFGDYGSAPEPIDFNLLGTTFTAFDITKYDDSIEYMRIMFVSFSYLWGFILFIKDFE